MANGIIKDFKDWNLITETSDMVGAAATQAGPGGPGGASSDTAKTSGGVLKAAYVPPAKTGGGFRSSTVATTTAAPDQPASQETLNKLATDIANMIVALFVDGNKIWSGENALKLDAKGWNDNEEDGVKIFDNYWTTNITPKINMLTAGDKNKISLTALQAQISKSILAGGTSALPFQIVTIVNNKPVAKNYTINTDF
jgi:hypothetical protein